ncbi:MAG: hypothetical protein ACLFNB_02340 [Candidatus Woesearchaeota archaeon]
MGLKRWLRAVDCAYAFATTHNKAEENMQRLRLEIARLSKEYHRKKDVGELESTLPEALKVPMTAGEYYKGLEHFLKNRLYKDSSNYSRLQKSLLQHDKGELIDANNRGRIKGYVATDAENGLIVSGTAMDMVPLKEYFSTVSEKRFKKDFADEITYDLDGNLIGLLIVPDKLTNPLIRHNPQYELKITSTGKVSENVFIKH